VLGHVRVEGTLGNEVQESGERLSRDTLAPILLADPIADEADTVLGPAPDVARDLAVDDDRLRDRRRVAEDVCRPMGVEGCAVAGGEGGHARGVGVELLLVEDGEVVELDVAESYFVSHFFTPGQTCRSISLLAVSDVRSSHWRFLNTFADQCVEIQLSFVRGSIGAIRDVKASPTQRWQTVFSSNPIWETC
jgi:hypothetical protein